MSIPTALVRMVRLAGLAATRRTTIGGHGYRLADTVRIDAFNEGLTAHLPETWMEDILWSLTLDGADFLDIGANIGQTLRAFLAASDDGRYWGFEPQIEPAAALQAFIGVNDLDRCKVLPIGLSDHAGFLTLRRGFAHDSTASFVDGYRPYDYHHSSVLVPVEHGDTVVAALGIADVAAIKVDVEGAELDVISGLSETIREHGPVIVFEVLQDWLLTTGARLSDEIVRFRSERSAALESTLNDAGYVIHQINAKARAVSPIVGGLASAPSGFHDANFIAVRGDPSATFGARLATRGWVIG